MQNANASGGARGGYGGGQQQQQPQFASYLQPPSAGAGADAEADLPSSLPSYMPSTTNSGAGGAAGRPPYGFDMLGRAGQPLARQEEMQHPYLAAAGGSTGDNGLPTKRQAPMGQWKTPPQFMYAPSSSASSASSSRPSSAGAAGGQPNRDSGRNSPSSGMRSMTFQDGNVAAAAMYAMPPGMMDEEQQQKIKRQEIGGISAAQFAASTGGLTMDATLLARVSGTDPSMMGSEEIKQIMRTPDLLSIYQKLQEEDDRRQRRLERNRASARVRREKKKGMVETYEGEVSKLENSLNLLKSHTFGSGQSSQLISALEYSSGEHLRHALMSKEAKVELMARILGQHSRNTNAIRRANYENQMLVAAATEDTDLAAGLRAQLNLTDDQMRQLQGMAHYVHDEARKLDAISKCFSALRAHDWLFFPGIETILHQTRNTMTSQQFQRFLSWTSDNRHVIERLQVLPTSSVSPSEENLAFEFHED